VGLKLEGLKLKKLKLENGGLEGFEAILAIGFQVSCPVNSRMRLKGMEWE